MFTFAYHRPSTIKDAATALQQQKDSKVLAGGHSLIPTLKLRLAEVKNLIDLNAIKGLDGIAQNGKNLEIGAMARHQAVADSAVVKKAIPGLVQLVSLIGDPHVRNRGTIGGSIANNDPAADYPAACLALGATIITTDRKIPADQFFKGLFETALNPGEIITAVSFPVPKRSGYAKFENPASRFALVGVFVAELDGEVRVAVTGAGQGGVFRSKELEAALKKKFSADACAGVKIGADGLNSDIHGDSAYRAHLIGVMTKRAVAAAG